MNKDYNICQHYNEGMCIHTNGKIGIFQKCIFENVSEDYKKAQMKNCNLRKTIDIIDKSLEGKVEISEQLK